MAEDLLLDREAEAASGICRGSEGGWKLAACTYLDAGRKMNMDASERVEGHFLWIMKIMEPPEDSIMHLCVIVGHSTTERDIESVWRADPAMRLVLENENFERTDDSPTCVAIQTSLQT